MNAGTTYRHKELLKLMTEKDVNENTARQYIKRALEKGYLEKMDNGDYLLATDDLPDE